MAVTIGVVIHARNVEVSTVDGGTTVWSTSVPVTPAAPAGALIPDVQAIADAFAAALAQAPRPRWPSPRVHVSIAEPFARVKLVRGVPPVRKQRELLALLRLNATHYVASAAPVILTGARVLRPSEVTVGVADLSLVHAVTERVEGVRLRMGFIVPVAALDGDPSLPPPTRGTDDNHPTLAARTAALGRSERLALSPRDNPARRRVPVSRLRLAVAYGAFAAAVTLGAYVHVVQMQSKVAALRTAERRAAPSADSALSDLRELGGLNNSLATAAEFSRQRVSTTLLLAALTDALPSGVAITTLRIDTASVDLVTLAPRTAAVIDALEDVPGVEAPTIIGPVSRDAIGVNILERATIRMHLTRGEPRGTTPFAVDREADRE